MIEIVEIISAGPTGKGVAVGGTTGQVLTKASDTDYDTEWSNPTGGGAGEAIFVTYDNTTSGLSAVNVQVAIDETEGRVDALEVTTHTHDNKALLDSITAAYTTTEAAKLSNIEDNATSDQTAGEIKTAYESNPDTNAFTDAEQTKLAGVAIGATANVPATTAIAGVVEKSTSAENVAGTSDGVYPSVAGVKEMIDTHVVTGTSWSLTFAQTGDLTSGDMWMADVSTVPQTRALPLAPSVDDEVIIKDDLGNAHNNTITVAHNGNPIMGTVEDFTISTVFTSVRLKWSGTDWRIVS